MTPHEQSHIQKAKHNAKHLSEVTPKLATCPDWCVTVAFYIALHYVEAFFAKKEIFPQDSSHEVRNSVISNCDEPELIAIKGKYLALYSKSKLARYNPTSHTFLGKDAPDFIKDGSSEIPRMLGYTP